MEVSLKSIIIDVVNEVYISELHNKYTGYLRITAHDLLYRLRGVDGIVHLFFTFLDVRGGNFSMAIEQMI